MMKLFRIVVHISALVFFLTLPVIPSISQNYRFTSLNASSYGLSNNSVKCMLKDSRGVVWVGTHKGLNRYNMNGFKSYDRHDIGSMSDFINCLVEDIHGNILIGTDDGIVIYDYMMDCFTRPDNYGILSDRVYTFCPDPAGRIWIGARTSGLFCYEPDARVLTRLDVGTSSGAVAKDIYRIASDRAGGLYLAMYCDDLYRMNPGADSPVLSPVCPDGYFEKDDIEGIVAGGTVSEELYVASKEHGLCRVGTEDGKAAVLCSADVAARPTGLTLDGRYLWMMTTSGLIRYDINEKSHSILKYSQEDRFSLSENHVTVLLPVDKESIWVGTAHSGVNYHSVAQDVFKKYYRTDDGMSLEGCRISDAVQGEDGVVWIATGSAGVLEFDVKNGNLKRYKVSDLIPDDVNALCIAGNCLWVGYNNGICRIDIRGGGDS
ncbi:MAG: hypothetical protein NC115_08475 [Bacteroidales bacterium]|nr:hypothetical protein [Bacteroidales bacterium]